MPMIDYPVDLTVDYPESSSRLWAFLMIVLVRFIILIPHFIALAFLSIAQFCLFVVAQVVVVFTGVYPARLQRYVGGVLRWGTKVFCYAVALTDVYPPFGFDEEDGPDYPARVRIDPEQKSSRGFAIGTLVFMGLVGVLLAFLIAHGMHTTNAEGMTTTTRFRVSWNSDLSHLVNLRFVILFPHGFVLFFLGIAAFVLVLMVPWAILFSGHVPRGMFDFIVGVQRWGLRVSAYGYGLTEKYPPFSLDPSTAPAGADVDAGVAPVGQGGMPAGGGTVEGETTGGVAERAAPPVAHETTGTVTTELGTSTHAEPAEPAAEEALTDHEEPSEIEYELADETALGEHWYVDLDEHAPYEEDEVDEE